MKQRIFLSVYAHPVAHVSIHPPRASSTPSYEVNQHKQSSGHNVPQSDIPSCLPNEHQPILIHYRTPPSVLHSIKNSLLQIHLYSIDTASDNTSDMIPRSTPALILVEALRAEAPSIVLLLEVQHLPPPSSPLFCEIRHLCQIIFSHVNTIMTWGLVLNKLHIFEQLKLFDISQITNTFNIQQSFTSQWNSHHPHTVECTTVHQQLPKDHAQSDVLICLVNTVDLEDDFDSDQPINDHNTCICPSHVRPYKAKNALWTLPKAVEFVFNRDVNQSFTDATWSCGLDLELNTWFTHDQKRLRERLLLHASNCLSASSSLFLHCEHLRTMQAHLHTSSKAQTVPMIQALTLPSFLVVADSHGRFMNPSLTTDHCQIVTKAISGLSWINPHNPALCATSLLTSPALSSLISSSTSLLLVIGTNSVRSTFSPKMSSMKTIFLLTILRIPSNLFICFSLSSPLLSSRYPFLVSMCVHNVLFSRRPVRFVTTSRLRHWSTNRSHLEEGRC